MIVSENNPHRRYNPLTGEWILVSAHRTSRPWQGLKEKVESTRPHSYDQNCYLCPGNLRANGEKNPDYKGTFVFTNDFPALIPQKSSSSQRKDNSLFRWKNVSGTSRVICYSPRHDLTMSELPLSGIQSVIETWIKQYQELSKEYNWVQIFENKGDIMGASNPHPHGQIWSGNFIPTQVDKENFFLEKYYRDHSEPLLLAYADKELLLKERIVCSNESWAAFVPFWATWPFETIVIPLNPLRRFTDITTKKKRSLAQVLKTLLIKYDNLFNVRFPYSMGWHGAPNHIENDSHWTLHAHFYPPLLRSASVRKFMVGYEMLAEAQRDLTPESAAQKLAELPGV
ncbi:MAG: galactose-1-phosphate uridylyltransferase [Candidatus Neomarinimicrobiota bacterium]|nr:MAG: galactose-1-phosphate uridylyltransferase [Candidatus Neomarinimicrobiota bacterium]